MKKSKIKIKKQCSGNEVFSNEGLLMEILLRLPVKSLVRFKCVSKQWSFLISSPYFTRLRIPCFNSPPRGLFLHSSLLWCDPIHQFVSLSLQENQIPAPPFQKLCFVYDPYGIRIRQSCNGLLLCCSYRARVCEKNYYIYNPTTRQFITLAKPVAAVGGGEEGGEIPMVVLGMTLAFDPRKSPHYKVICVRILSELAHEQQQQHYQIEIYSSETKKWRVSGPPFPARRDINFTFDGVYWNGGIYWPCGDNSLCFNIEEEKFKRFTMPCNIRQSWEEDDGESRIAYYGECCGHLNLVQVHSRQKLSFYNIYEMKSDGTLDWFLKYQVNVEGVFAAFPRTIRRRYLEQSDWHYYAMAVLYAVTGEKEEEVEDAFLVLYIPKMVIRFNLKGLYILQAISIWKH